MPSGPSELSGTVCSFPPVLPIWKAGVPAMPAALAARLASAISATTHGALRAATRARAGDLVEQRLGHPAAVLVALAVIEVLDDVPETVLTPGGDRGAQRSIRVGPEEREPAEHDPHLALPHVPVDERREGAVRPLGAVRALEICVLHERHRGLRAPQRIAALGNPVEDGGKRLRGGSRSLFRPKAARTDQRAAEDEGADEYSGQPPARAHGAQWDIVPSGFPTFSRPTWPRST